MLVEGTEDFSGVEDGRRNGESEPDHSTDSNRVSPIASLTTSALEIRQSSPPTPHAEEIGSESAIKTTSSLDKPAKTLEMRSSDILAEKIRQKSLTRYSNLVAARSPTTWPERHSSPITPLSNRPAFVYCGPGSRRIPGVPAQQGSLGKRVTPDSQSPVTHLTSTIQRGSSNPRSPARSSLLTANKSQSPLLTIPEQPGVTILSAHQEMTAIQPLGDASRRRTPTRRPLRSSAERTPSSGLPNKPFKSIMTESSCYTAIWRGPEFVTERSTRWNLSVDLLNQSPVADAVFLSGLILHPAVYLRPKNDIGKPILIEPEAIFGTIRVHNYAFEKSITVRATFDKWLTYVDQPAKYISSHDASTSAKSKFDTFAFRFSLPESSEEFEFAIHYRWWTPEGGGSAWDNNGGQNYVIHRKAYELRKPNIEMTPVLENNFVTSA